ncbi:UNVERIFIED_CONTAM: hypothetical protein FKN15_039212 [Acipenser sinensis]
MRLEYMFTALLIIATAEELWKCDWNTCSLLFLSLQQQRSCGNATGIHVHCSSYHCNSRGAVEMRLEYMFTALLIIATAEELWKCDWNTCSLLFLSLQQQRSCGNATGIHVHCSSYHCNSRGAVEMRLEYMFTALLIIATAEELWKCDWNTCSLLFLSLQQQRSCGNATGIHVHCSSYHCNSRGAVEMRLEYMFTALLIIATAEELWKCDWNTCSLLFLSLQQQRSCGNATGIHVHCSSYHCNSRGAVEMRLEYMFTALLIIATAEELWKCDWNTCSLLFLSLQQQRSCGNATGIHVHCSSYHCNSRGAVEMRLEYMFTALLIIATAEELWKCDWNTCSLLFLSLQQQRSCGNATGIHVHCSSYHCNSRGAVEMRLEYMFTALLIIATAEELWKCDWNTCSLLFLSLQQQRSCGNATGIHVHCSSYHCNSRGAVEMRLEYMFTALLIIATAEELWKCDWNTCSLLFLSLQQQRSCGNATGIHVHCSSYHCNSRGAVEMRLEYMFTALLIIATAEELWKCDWNTCSLLFLSLQQQRSCGNATGIHVHCSSYHCNSRGAVEMRLEYMFTALLIIATAEELWKCDWNTCSLLFLSLQQQRSCGNATGIHVHCSSYHCNSRGAVEMRLEYMFTALLIIATAEELWKCDWNTCSLLFLSLQQQRSCGNATGIHVHCSSYHCNSRGAVEMRLEYMFTALLIIATAEELWKCDWNTCSLLFLSLQQQRSCGNATGIHVHCSSYHCNSRGAVEMRLEYMFTALLIIATAEELWKCDWNTCSLLFLSLQQQRSCGNATGIHVHCSSYHCNSRGAVEMRLEYMFTALLIIATAEELWKCDWNTCSLLFLSLQQQRSCGNATGIHVHCSSYHCNSRGAVEMRLEYMFTALLIIATAEELWKCDWNTCSLLFLSLQQQRSCGNATGIHVHCSSYHCNSRGAVEMRLEYMFTALLIIATAEELWKCDWNTCSLLFLSLQQQRSCGNATGIHVHCSSYHCNSRGAVEMRLEYMFTALLIIATAEELWKCDWNTCSLLFLSLQQQRSCGNATGIHVHCSSYHCNSRGAVEMRLEYMFTALLIIATAEELWKCDWNTCSLLFLSLQQQRSCGNATGIHVHCSSYHCNSRGAVEMRLEYMFTALLIIATAEELWKCDWNTCSLLFLSLQQQRSCGNATGIHVHCSSYHCNSRGAVEMRLEYMFTALLIIATAEELWKCDWNTCSLLFLSLQQQRSCGNATGIHVHCSSYHCNSRGAVEMRLEYMFTALLIIATAEELWKCDWNTCSLLFLSLQQQRSCGNATGIHVHCSSYHCNSRGAVEMRLEYMFTALLIIATAEELWKCDWNTCSLLFLSLQQQRSCGNATGIHVHCSSYHCNSRGAVEMRLEYMFTALLIIATAEELWKCDWNTCSLLFLSLQQQRSCGNATGIHVHCSSYHCNSRGAVEMRLEYMFTALLIIATAEELWKCDWNTCSLLFLSLQQQRSCGNATGIHVHCSSYHCNSRGAVEMRLEYMFTALLIIATAEELWKCDWNTCSLLFLSLQQQRSCGNATGIHVHCSSYHCNSRGAVEMRLEYMFTALLIIATAEELWKCDWNTCSLLFLSLQQQRSCGNATGIHVHCSSYHCNSRGAVEMRLEYMFTALLIIATAEELWKCDWNTCSLLFLSLQQQRSCGNATGIHVHCSSYHCNSRGAVEMRLEYMFTALLIIATAEELWKCDWNTCSLLFLSLQQQRSCGNATGIHVHCSSYHCNSRGAVEMRLEYMFTALLIIATAEELWKCDWNTCSLLFLSLQQQRSCGNATGIHVHCSSYHCNSRGAVEMRLEYMFTALLIIATAEELWKCDWNTCSLLFLSLQQQRSCGNATGIHVHCSSYHCNSRGAVEMRLEYMFTALLIIATAEELWKCDWNTCSLLFLSLQQQRSCGNATGIHVHCSSYHCNSRGAVEMRLEYMFTALLIIATAEELWKCDWNTCSLLFLSLQQQRSCGNATGIHVHCSSYHCNSRGAVEMRLEYMFTALLIIATAEELWKCDWNTCSLLFLSLQQQRSCGNATGIHVHCSSYHCNSRGAVEMRLEYMFTALLIIATAEELWKCDWNTC